jgi:hypothetical protein
MVRAKSGRITEFDAPGAGTGFEQGTGPDGDINTAGVIAGDYSDSGTVYHGAVRAVNGTISEFDAPGAGTGVGQGTMPNGINTAGAITGRYADSGTVFHGFLRTP